ncbi:MAG: VOC family protein [Phycisphaerales bacterium]|nr:VOC family protein [Phycisphaerales bacterium]
MKPARAVSSRTRLAMALVVAFAGPAVAQTPVPTSEAANPPPLVVGVGPIAIVVQDLEPAIEWYTSTLDFTLVDECELAGDGAARLTGQFGVRCRVARLSLGREQIQLIDYLAPEGRPIPPDSRSNDRWFQHIAIVVRDIDEAYARLRSANVRHASSGPQTLPDWNPNAGGISAFYFKDPDGHVLEIIHFPPGKGDPRWQAPDAPLFMGIDHTAIVVADTETSLAFYRDTLGLRIAGASENYGTEQEHLNNVFGARLRITALRTDSGPGLELLEYLAPGGGRAFPVDTQASDLWNWHTTLIAPDADAAFEAARAGGAWVSPGIEPGVGPLAPEGGAMARDPDGHALLLVRP